MTWLDFNAADDQSETLPDIDVEAVRAVALQRLEGLLYQLFPLGKVKQRRFYIGNIKGDKGKSLVVELHGDKAGQWHDFATGDGGDIVKLWALVQGFGDSKSDFAVMVKSLAEYLGDISIASNQPRHQTKTPPIDELGPFTAKWDYHDAAGKLLACVYRHDTDAGKVFRLWDAKRQKAAAPNPRPLYQIPTLLKAATVIIVEGEKCTDALLALGITATTAMNGANAPLDKTDWTPLKDKQLVIWPDHDEAGQTYAAKLQQYLTTQGIGQPIILPIPPNKPTKWDAADAVQEGFDIKAWLLKHVPPSLQPIDPTAWQGTPPQRKWLIEGWLPRGYVTALYGDGGVGKSLLAQQLMTSLATGKAWLGVPTKPLRVYGLMCEDDGDELWRRQVSINRQLQLPMTALHNMRFVSRLGSNNLLMTFDGKDVGKLTPFFEHLLIDIQNFEADIVVLDTAADLFGGHEINRTHVRQFIQNACGAIARAIDGAVLLCAHPSDSGIQRNTGTGGSTAWNNTVRSRWYLTRPLEQDADPNARILSRKKANYAGLGDDMHLRWQDGAFAHIHPDPHAKKYIGNSLAVKHERERQRKKDAILDLIASEALKGNVYTANQFAHCFEDRLKLGSESTIRRRVATYSTKGWIKFFNNYHQYNLPASSSTQGYLCVQGMQLGLEEERFNPDTQLLERVTTPVYPTHYVHPGSSQLERVENPHVWVEQEMGDANA